jgi:hypothetical protein
MVPMLVLFFRVGSRHRFLRGPRWMRSGARDRKQECEEESQ